MGLTDNSFNILYLKLVGKRGGCQGDIFRLEALGTLHMMSATNYFASSCHNDDLFLSFNFSRNDKVKS